MLPHGIKEDFISFFNIMETTAENLYRKVEGIQKCLFNGFLIDIIHNPPEMVNWNTSSSILCSDENLSAI